MTSGGAIVRLHRVRRDYQALRPLRINEFELGPSDTVSLIGIDRVAAEVLVNMITAATLPDEGDVVIFGRSTRDITTTDAWFSVLDQVGILSERVVLIDELTVRQNVALPLSLDVQSMSTELSRTVDALCAEVGIPDGEVNRPIGAASTATRLRVRLAKALALNPPVILGEHPNASLPAEAVAAFARDLASIVARRGIAMLLLTADTAFAAAACRRVLTLSPATGELSASSGWRRWLGAK